MPFSLNPQSKNMMIKPILVVGAGPVGMTMASELARYGVPVRIVDKAAQRTDKSKALVLWSRTLELLIAAQGPIHLSMPGSIQSRQLHRRRQSDGRVSTESVQSPYPYGLMLPQSETERLLEERLGNLGVVVERRVNSPASSAARTGFDAVLRHAEGREEHVSTDWLVGCDGAHSAVRHGLGAPFAGETLKSDWMLADVHMTGYPHPDSEASVSWHHDGVFVIFRSRRAAIEFWRTCRPPAPSNRRHQRWSRFAIIGSARSRRASKPSIQSGSRVSGSMAARLRAIAGAAPSSPAMPPTSTVRREDKA